ncbi:unnamed protein product [Amoebophrya sp. A120]|nr:unnamed protein product [Amoebophrya sp. A120]|eukprot:GSA120T00015464001.1
MIPKVVFVVVRCSEDISWLRELVPLFSSSEGAPPAAAQQQEVVHGKSSRNYKCQEANFYTSSGPRSSCQHDDLLDRQENQGENTTQNETSRTTPPEDVVDVWPTITTGEDEDLPTEGSKTRRRDERTNGRLHKNQAKV